MKSSAYERVLRHRELNSAPTAELVGRIAVMEKLLALLAAQSKGKNALSRVLLGFREQFLLDADSATSMGSRQHLDGAESQLAYLEQELL